MEKEAEPVPTMRGGGVIGDWYVHLNASSINGV